MEENNNKMNNLFFDESFFDWLINQMDKHYYAVYNRESTDTNAKQIPLLFKLVENYATANSLSPIKMLYYNIYYVNYNGHIFSIFEHISDVNYEYGCYANPLSKADIPYFINFDDIKNSNQDYLSKVLVTEIEERMQKLRENGVSIEDIRNIVNCICDNFKNTK